MSNADDTELSAQEEYPRLLSVRSNIENQIQKCRERIRQEYVDSCESFKLPEDAHLNWWGTLEESVHIDYQGKVSVFTHVPSIQNGYDTRDYKAGTNFVVLKSWKTNKKTNGTHYILLNKRTGRTTHYYG